MKSAESPSFDGSPGGPAVGAREDAAAVRRRRAGAERAPRGAVSERPLETPGAAEAGRQASAAVGALVQRRSADLEHGERHRPGSPRRIEEDRTEDRSGAEPGAACHQEAPPSVAAVEPAPGCRPLAAKSARGPARVDRDVAGEGSPGGEAGAGVRVQVRAAVACCWKAPPRRRARGVERSAGARGRGRATADLCRGAPSPRRPGRAGCPRCGKSGPPRTGRRRGCCGRGGRRRRMARSAARDRGRRRRPAPRRRRRRWS